MVRDTFDLAAVLDKVVALQCQAPKSNIACLLHYGKWCFIRHFFIFPLSRLSCQLHCELHHCYFELNFELQA